MNGIGIWTGKPTSPVRHIEGPDRNTLCGRNRGRCYFETPSEPANCPKCARALRNKEAPRGQAD